MQRIILVRHGETSWNAENRFQGQSDTPLSEEGKVQAQCVAARLSDEEVKWIWSSDLQRARATAEAIAVPHGVPTRAYSDLRERGYGDWEGKTRAEIEAEYGTDTLVSFGSGVEPPGAESVNQVWARMVRVFDQVLHESVHETAIIVGHGGSMKVIVCIALGCGPEALQHITLDNASVSIIEIASGSMKLRLLNDTHHLARR